MKATLVPDKLTPLAAPDVVRAFRRAFFGVTMRMPSNETLAILVAQSALESGRWKSLHCFNFTNIKASEDYIGSYCLYRCNEIIRGKVEWFDPPHPQCRFRAFENIDDGALDYLNFLANRKRYASAWACALRGDPGAFVAALKAAGFFTASEEPYRKAVVSLTNEYLRQIPGWLAAPAPPTEDNPPLAPPAGMLLDQTDQLHALAVHAATEAMYDGIDDVRRDAHQQMHEADPDEITVNENPSRNS